MQACRYIYNPLESEEFTFIVCFDQDAEPEQEQRAAKVIAHLESLEADALADESVKFFKWLVLYRLSECNTLYAQLLLDHFHSKGLLLCKRSVHNPTKQMKARYLVMFTLGGHTFAKAYNSIRELKADTGRKPSQIRRQPTKDLICELLKK